MAMTRTSGAMAGGVSTPRAGAVLGRRGFLAGAALGLVGLLGPGAFAEELTRTPRQTEGPFYPDKLPLDTDNDLLIINDGDHPRRRRGTYLSGRVLDAKGEPGPQRRGRDLAGRPPRGLPPQPGPATPTAGRPLPGLRPVPHRLDRRVPVPDDQAGPLPRPDPAHPLQGQAKGGQELLTTQCYIKGHPGNARDMVLRGIRDPKARESVMVDFDPIEGSKVGELAARFDVVLGFTPEA